MKVYQVVWRMGAWHALSPTTGEAIVSSEDKLQLLDWVLQVAQKHQGEVHVCDEAGSVIQRICSHSAAG